MYVYSVCDKLTRIRTCYGYILFVCGAHVSLLLGRSQGNLQSLLSAVQNAIHPRSMDYPPSPSVDGVSLPCLPPRARTPPTPTSAVDSAASSPSAPAKRTSTHLDCEITHTAKRARGIEETTIASQEMFGFSLFSDTGPTPTSFADLPPLDLTLSLTDSGTALDFSALGLGTGSLPLLDESSWQLLTGGFDLTTPLELTLDGLEQPIQQAKGHGQQGTQLAVSSVGPPTQTEKRKCPRCAVNLKPTYINLEEQILLCRKCDFPLGADDDPLEYIIPCPGSKGVDLEHP